MSDHFTFWEDSWNEEYEKAKKLVTEGKTAEEAVQEVFGKSIKELLDDQASRIHD